MLYRCIVISSRLLFSKICCLNKQNAKFLSITSVMGSRKGVSRGKYSKKLVTPSRVCCWTCGKWYNRKPILDHHIKTKHLRQHIKCPICGKRLSSTSVCNRHLKDVHNITHLRGLGLKYEVDLATAAKSTRGSNKYELSFEGHKEFPHTANVLTFKEDETFGHHMVAESDINVGKVIIIVFIIMVY